MSTPDHRRREKLRLEETRALEKRRRKREADNAKFKRLPPEAKELWRLWDKRTHGQTFLERWREMLLRDICMRHTHEVVEITGSKQMALQWLRFARFDIPPLPDPLRIYRGVSNGAHREDIGLYWTPSLEIAMGYALSPGARNREQGGEDTGRAPHIFATTIRRKQILWALDYDASTRSCYELIPSLKEGWWDYASKARVEDMAVIMPHCWRAGITEAEAATMFLWITPSDAADLAGILG